MRFKVITLARFCKRPVTITIMASACSHAQNDLLLFSSSKFRKLSGIIYIKKSKSGDVCKLEWTWNSFVWFYKTVHRKFHIHYNIYLLTIYLIIMHQTQLEERIDFINYKNIIAKSYGIIKSRIIEEKESERRILLLFNLN